MPEEKQMTDLYVSWIAPGEDTDVVFPHVYLCSLEGGPNSTEVAYTQASLARFIVENGAVGGVITATGEAGSFDDMAMENHASFMRGIRFVMQKKDGVKTPF